jgi:hypothetical protein
MGNGVTTFRGMEVEPIASAVSAPRTPPQPMGISAQLADARAQLRDAAPSKHWQGVLAEVSRLQFQEKMSPLAALQAVYAKLASGWLPPVSRT